MAGSAGVRRRHRVIQHYSKCDFASASADILPNRKNKRRSSRQAWGGAASRSWCIRRKTGMRRSAFALASRSRRMLAVFLAKSTLASVTPGTLSSAFLTVIGQTAQVIFCTSRVTVCMPPANAANGTATAAPSIKQWSNPGYSD